MDARYIVVISVLVVAACSEAQMDDPEAGRVGADFAQCESRPGGGVDQSAAVTGTIQAQVPGQAINCTDKRTFAYQGRDVHLVFVAFGTVSDCPAGCFSGDVCAIYDDPQSLLYSTTSNPPPDRPGLAHGLTQTAEFSAFKAAQQGSGEWRFCFRDH